MLDAAHGHGARSSRDFRAALKAGAKEADEHVPPDTTAAIFWLKNRDPAHWRDAWQMEHVLGKYIISDRPMTEEEWIRERGATVIDATPEPPEEDKS